jgi:uncharacterized protein (DUF2384 family)
MQASSLMESGYYSRIIEDLRETALTAAEVASIAGVKERQVQHWVAGTHRPKGAKRDRLLELVYIVDRLRDVYRPEGIDIWIHGRNRDLDGRRPIDLLEQGDFATVLNAVERLETGAM